MKTRFLLPHGQGARLTRSDLIDFEQLLKDSIHAFLPFTGYSLFFPASLPEEMRTGNGFSPSTALHLSNENKILLPLFLRGEFLGVFVAKGVKMRTSKGLLANMAGMAELCLEKLLLIKAGRTDPLTGMLNRDCFLAELSREIELIRDCIGPGGEMSCQLPAYRACMGVVIARVESLADMQREHGYAFADKVMQDLAKTMRDMCPDQSVAARYDENVFTMLLPGALSSACHKTARVLAARLDSVVFSKNMLGERVSPKISAGSVAYPNDLDGALFELPPMEQARIILQRAHLAADAAKALGPGRAFAFGRILREGGRITQSLPGNRIMVNLGRNVNAREGCRFLVRGNGKNNGSNGSGPVEPKGEIVLLEVMEDTGMAEVVLLGDPLTPLEQGDRLTLADERMASPMPEVVGQDASLLLPDPVTGLHGYQNFVLAASMAARDVDEFSLAMVRLSLTADKNPETYLAKAEELACLAADLGRDLFGNKVLGGRLSLAGAAFFHPALPPEDAQQAYSEYRSRVMDKAGVDTVVGIAYHPCLTFAKTDIFDNARKALEYARLLEAPRIGVFDTLALNISADKLSLTNDLYGAMEEYKRSLLLDETNTLARVSLGICQARLGHYDQAKRLFEQVCADEPDNHMALYNLGYASQRLGDLSSAKDAFRACLKVKPDHVYSIIRLGRAAEEEGALDVAENYFQSAAMLGDGHALAPRYLARLCIKQDRKDQAKDHLHQALTRDPNDALSLHLLAKLYLDHGEDAEIAESFARQSVALRPDRKPFWMELARAFEAQGKIDQAHTALAKTAEM